MKPQVALNIIGLSAAFLMMGFGGAMLLSTVDVAQETYE